MQERDFEKYYLAPSESRLDQRFRFPPPPIPELAKESDYIIQCETGDTCSTNIIRIYRSELSGIKLKETYKNTQNQVTGIFVRLVGSIALVVPGYPRCLLDAAVKNVNPVTGAAENLTTKAAVHLPQATPEQQELFYGEIRRLTSVKNILYFEHFNERLPNFWGKSCWTQSDDINLEIIHSMRDITWDAFRTMMQHTDSCDPFDYQPFIEYMVANTSQREHEVFAQMGMSVPKEAQSAFFSVQI